ncbi:MAG: efflux RND transporter permease subunit, partial [Bacteroidota bacterium]
ADQVRNELLKIEDVAKVDIHGTQPERVFVEYDNARLAELGLSPGQLQNALQVSNIIISGGTVQTGAETIALEPSGSFDTVDAIRRSVITLPGSGQVVFLDDIARVERGYVNPRSEEVRISGREGLVLAISMRDGGDIIALGDEVLATTARLEARFPVGVEFGVVSFQPEVVERSVSDFTTSVAQSVAVVIFAMLLFLGLRTGLIVATLIPMAMVTTMLFMGIFEIGIDQISLAALIIALGLLVDNAIVMSEAIMVGMEDGKPAKTAAIDAAKELRIPLLVSSLTTAAAFLPISLAESQVGEYTAPLAQVIIITLLASWVLSLTMIPLLCVVFLKVTPRKEGEEEYSSVFYQRYRNLLTSMVKRPLLTVLAAYGLLVVALWGFGFVAQSFFPEKKEVLFTGQFELPYGTSFEETKALTDDIEAFMAAEFARSERAPGTEPEDDEVALENWAFFIGIDAPRFNLGYNPEQARTNYAALVANSTTFEAQAEIIERLRAYVEINHPGVDADIKALTSGPGGGDPVAVRLYGDDPSVLFGFVDQVKAHLATLEGTRNVTDNWGAFTKKLRVEIDEARAARAGVSNQDIAVSLQSALSGIEATQFREGNELIPVTLRSTDGARAQLSEIESINVYSQSSGRNVPLGQVATIELDFEPSRVLRRDRQLAVTVASGLDDAAGVTAFDVVAELDPWLQEQQATWPVGYAYEIGGEFESSSEANASIGAQLPLAGLVILMLLVWQFNSLRKPTIILLTIPLALIGVTIGLLVTRLSFGFMSLLGIIALAGIVINNAIVLIDRIQLEMDENGHEPMRAIIEAGQRRFRPILLTTATTAGGLVPLWLSGSPLFESMSVAILFGLIFATVLTLGFVPALYALFFRVRGEDDGTEDDLTADDIDPATPVVPA